MGSTDKNLMVRWIQLDIYKRIKANILICTLGASWAVIPEVYGFINSKNLPLYQNAANFESLKSSIDEFSLQPGDEIWICTTQGETMCASLDKLKEWLALLSPSVIARIWQAEKKR